MGDCSVHMTKIAPFPGTTQRSAWERVLLMAGDEGFEPPQTESESGVLPLHKSPVFWLQGGTTFIIIRKTGQMSRRNF